MSTVSASGVIKPYVWHPFETPTERLGLLILNKVLFFIGSEV